MEFKNAQEAFNQAINEGRLSDNESDRYYAGDFMYMGTYDGADHFKHIRSRKYLNTMKADDKRREEAERQQNFYTDRYTDAGGSAYSDADPGL